MIVLSLISYTIDKINTLFNKFINALFRKIKHSNQLKRCESGYLNKNISNKLTIVLDLDNIIIYQSLQKLNNCRSHIVINNRVYLYIRPHLENFLNDLSEHCELVVYTTYEKDYADQIINLVDKNKRISRRFYKEDCVNKDSNLYKDVMVKGFEESRVIIIDDDEVSHLTYKSKMKLILDNIIPIKSWDGSESNDDSLLKIRNVINNFLYSGLMYDAWEMVGTCIKNDV